MGINVLALCDGCSAGQVALDQLNVVVDNYFACEIDEYPIAVTQHHYPNTIQLGDIKTVSGYELPKIDLLIGGFPCQTFSFAGKQENFNDEKGKLFFECVRLLKETRPKYFMFENVVMKKEYQDTISSFLGVEPILMNSALVSGQNRKRLYWIGTVDQITGKISPLIVEEPEDKGILLVDILEDKADLKEYIISDKAIRYMNGTDSTGSTTLSRKHHCDTDNNKSATMIANLAKGCPYNVIIDRRPVKKILGGAQRGRDVPEGGTRQFMEVRQDGKSNALTSAEKDNRVCLVRDLQKSRYEVADLMWRKLTPKECERLQTFPDNYSLVPWLSRMMAATRRYFMMGNSWTIDMIKHIFSAMKLGKKREMLGFKLKANSIILHKRMIHAHQRIANGLHDKQDDKLKGKILTHMACIKVLQAMRGINDLLIPFDEVMESFKMPINIKFQQKDLYKINITLQDCA